MANTVVNKANITNLLHRQIQWLTEEELKDLAIKFGYTDKGMYGGWSFCHFIVHEGHLKPFVDHCKKTFDDTVKKRQNPPRDALKLILKKMIDLGTLPGIHAHEALDAFAKSVDWVTYVAFQNAAKSKLRELTDEEKYDIIIGRMSTDGLTKKIFDSWRWRNFWLLAVDTIIKDIEEAQAKAADEEDMTNGYFGYMGYGF